jgi:hypothetical protein
VAADTYGVLRLVLLTAGLVAVGISKLAGLTPHDLLRLAGQLLAGHPGALRGF